MNEISESLGGTSQEQPVTSGEATSDISEFSIPEQYSDKGWAKQINSVDQLWKSVESLQALKGKKDFGMPEDNATAEQWNEYYSKLRPQDPNSYILHGEGSEFNEDFESNMKNAFYEVGLTEKQASFISEKFNEFTSSELAKAKEADKSHDDSEFDRLSSEAFGGEEGAQKAIEVAKGMLNEYVDESYREQIAKLDNASLIAITSVMNNVHSKYGLESNKLANSSDANAGKTFENIRAEAQEVTKKLQEMASKNQHVFNPEYERLIERRNNLYKQLPAE